MFYAFVFQANPDAPRHWFVYERSGGAREPIRLVAFLNEDGSDVDGSPRLDFIDQVLAYCHKGGGGTFDLTREAAFEPTSGYFVSAPGLEVRLPRDGLTYNAVSAYVRMLHRMRKAGSGKLGIWFDRDTQEWCLDVSYWVGCLICALEFARRGNQKAIWDCAQGIEREVS